MPAMHARNLRSVPSNSHRAALGAAIARREAARRKLAAVNDAIAAVFRDRVALRDALAQAEAAIPIADRAATDAVIAKAMGDKVGPTPSPAEARAAVEKLAGEIEVSRATTAKLEAALRETEAALATAIADVQAEVRNVVWAAPETLRMLHDLSIAVRTHQNLFAAVQAIGLLPDELRHHTIINPPVDLAVADRFGAAMKVLENDASAPVPEAD